MSGEREKDQELICFSRAHEKTVLGQMVLLAGRWRVPGRGQGLAWVLADQQSRSRAKWLPNFHPWVVMFSC